MSDTEEKKVCVCVHWELSVALMSAWRYAVTDTHTMQSVLDCEML